MVNFDLVVGNQYPVSNGNASAQLTFLGLVGNGARRALLFDNPSLLGYPFPYIGASIEVVLPAASTPTITVEARIRARLGGASPTSLHLLDRISSTWGTLP